MNYKCLLNSATKVVVNVILLEDGAEWAPPEGQELAPQHDGNIGDVWDGTKFISSSPPDPSMAENLGVDGAGPNVIG